MEANKQRVCAIRSEYQEGVAIAFPLCRVNHGSMCLCGSALCLRSPLHDPRRLDAASLSRRAPLQFCADFGALDTCQMNMEALVCATTCKPGMARSAMIHRLPGAGQKHCCLLLCCFLASSCAACLHVD